MQTVVRPPLYWTWKNMRERCEKPYCKDYSRYGGRGIKVCDRWKTFANFVADMGERPGKNYSLDRINNNGDYTPSNVRWATRKEQTHNSRVVKLSPKEVEAIRTLYAKGNITQETIGKLYNIDQSVVSRIVNERIW